MREAPHAGKVGAGKKSVEELRSEVLRLNDGLQQRAKALQAEAVDFAAKHMGARMAEVQGKAKTLQESAAQAFPGATEGVRPAKREAPNAGKVGAGNKSVEELRSEVLRLNDRLQQRAKALQADAVDLAAKHMGARMAEVQGKAKTLQESAAQAFSAPLSFK